MGKAPGAWERSSHTLCLFSLSPLSLASPSLSLSLCVCVCVYMRSVYLYVLFVLCVCVYVCVCVCVPHIDCKCQGAELRTNGYSMF